MSESQYRFHRLPEFDYSTPGAMLPIRTGFRQKRTNQLRL